MEDSVRKEGEAAAFELGLFDLHPEILRLMGRLKYRTSYGQNVLNHSKEVAFLAGTVSKNLLFRGGVVTVADMADVPAESIASPATPLARAAWEAYLEGAVKAVAALDPALEFSGRFFEGAGCIECGGTGYKGRTAICELLDLTDNIREMILDRRPTSEIKKVARDEGMRFLRECAVERVLEGTTTLREINKVTFVE